MVDADSTFIRAAGVAGVCDGVGGGMSEQTAESKSYYSWAYWDNTANQFFFGGWLDKPREPDLDARGEYLFMRRDDQPPTLMALPTCSINIPAIHRGICSAGNCSYCVAERLRGATIEADSPIGNPHD